MSFFETGEEGEECGIIDLVEQRCGGDSGGGGGVLVWVGWVGRKGRDG